MKKLIADFFGIATHEEEVKRLAGENFSLSQELKAMRNAYKYINEKYQELQKISVDPIKYVDEETRKLEEQFTRCANVCEDIVAEVNERQEKLDREVHRAYANGRADAYAEMGIRNIEAHERGNELAILENGEIVELLLGLEDVKPSGNKATATEISLDDLTEEEHKELEELSKVYYT